MHRVPLASPPSPGGLIPRIFLAVLLCLLGINNTNAQPPKETETVAKIFSTPYERADGTTETLSLYRGKAIMIVNTASECGFTPQYADLEKLYQLYKDRGFVVIAFPSNEFGGQEPGTNAEIQEFCSSRYKVSFPVMGKTNVNYPIWSPFFEALTEGNGQHAGGFTWNFEKILINADGELVARFRSRVSPMLPEVIAAVEAALPKSPPK